MVAVTAVVTTWARLASWSGGVRSLAYAGAGGGGR
jgi:hypothetical protein